VVESDTLATKVHRKKTFTVWQRQTDDEMWELSINNKL